MNGDSEMFAKQISDASLNHESVAESVQQSSNTGAGTGSADSVPGSVEGERGASEDQRSDALVNSPADRLDTETGKPTIGQKTGGDCVLPPSGGSPVLGSEVETDSIPEFIPTRGEVIQLVKYWHGIFLGDDWFYFLYGKPWTTAFRREGYAQWRIKLAASAIGDEPVDQAIKEVADEFKSKLEDPRLWDIYKNGTGEQ